MNNEYEPPLMPYDPDLQPGFSWWWVVAGVAGLGIVGTAIYLGSR